EAIVEQELSRFIQAFKGRQLGPTITALRARVLGLAKAEAEKLCAGMPQLDERGRRAILAFADNLAKKVLHAPQMALKKDGGDRVSLVLAVQRLFELELAVVEPVAEPDDDAAVAAAAPESESGSKKVAGQ